MPVKPRRPHRLSLYVCSVQHPMAEVAMIETAYAQHSDSTPLLLREDFAGTSAVAMAWVASDPDRQAMAIERHGPTARWAAKRCVGTLGQRADDLHIVEADVHAVPGPKVDVTAVLNFSLCELHTRKALVGYLKHSRKGLRPDGMIYLDLFGGPGSQRVGTQTRRHEEPIDPCTGERLAAFDYQWEQRAFDASRGRIDCRVHFGFDDGHVMSSAFRYDWRLWTPAEVWEALDEAGFRNVTVWCDRYDEDAGSSDGVYRPVKALPTREDWVVYITATR
ncbi:MAG: hypothetical protein RLN76_11175 [Phycisphaeraceae bacterium]